MTGRNLVIAVGGVALCAALTVFYARIGRGASLDSDNATAVLQGQEILRGNLLLSGWWLPGDSFWSTDLPLYTAAVALFGVSPRPARYVAAAVYAATVGITLLLATTSRRRNTVLLQVLFAFALVAVPAAGWERSFALRAPYHLTTTLYVLLSLLAIDRMRIRGAAWVVFVLLAIAQLGDPYTLVLGVLPLIAVAGVRIVQTNWRDQDGWWLLLPTVGSVVAARFIQATIGILHGFRVVPLAAAFVQLDELPRHAILITHLYLDAFGADFFGLPLGRSVVLPLLRAAALVLVFIAGWSVIQRWRREPQPGLVNQLVVAGLLIQAGALFFSSQASDLAGVRYASPFLFLAAVLAARVGIPLLATDGARALALALSAVVLLAPAWSAYRAPAVADRPTQLVPWLRSHGLHEGLSGYWEASSVTLESGNTIQVRGVVVTDRRVMAFQWLSKDEWYDGSRHDARFVLIDTRNGISLQRPLVEQAFGTPTEEHEVDGYVVLMYNHNLLLDPAWAG